MKIQFKNPEKPIELLKAMASKNRHTVEAAMETFGALISPTIGEFYEQADTTKMLYDTIRLRDGEDAEFPATPYVNVDAGEFAVWSQAMPGGLASNRVYQPTETIKLSTLNITSAISVLQKFAAKGRLDIFGDAIAFLMQEILLKTNSYAWSVALAALAQASHRVNGVATGHVFASAAQDQFTLDDYNNLLTRFYRLNASKFGGTQVGRVGQPTDIIVSPEMMAYFRSMAYNPINTLGGNRTAITANTQAAAGATVALPDAQRSALFQSAGVPEFYGIAISQLNELGINQAYENIFEQYIGSTVVPKVDGTGGSETFDPSADELVIVLDATKALGKRVLFTDSDTGSVFTLRPDNQFPERAKVNGWYGEVEAGWAVLDTRGLAGLVV